jgi:D-beta-D-heptose 7-phosphate kinase/D-beta-D-heptose 1-phosphate adenosyltransferase
MTTLEALDEAFPSLHLLVIGDLMLDRYIWSAVERISPEAPVPVARVLRQTETLGGAANVAANARALGCQVTLAGYLGEDAEAQTLAKLVEHQGITRVLIPVAGRRTTTKTRIMGGRQQMLRLDLEDREPADRLFEQALLSQVEALRPHAVILSDYAKGACTPSLCRTLVDFALHWSAPLLVDPKGRDWEKYRGASGLTPNRAELAAFVGSPLSSIEAVMAAADQVRRQLKLQFLAATLSEDGIVWAHETGCQQAPAQAREVCDVSGAGDTVVATLAAALAAGLALPTAVQLANLAAGLVVARLGTGPIDRLALQRAVRDAERAQAAP